MIASISGVNLKLDVSNSNSGDVLLLNGYLFYGVSS